MEVRVIRGGKLGFYDPAGVRVGETVFGKWGTNLQIILQIMDYRLQMHFIGIFRPNKAIKAGLLVVE